MDAKKKEAIMECTSLLFEYARSGWFGNFEYTFAHIFPRKNVFFARYSLIKMRFCFDISS